MLLLWLACAHAPPAPVQVGPRPHYLVEDMAPSPLKETLRACADGPFYATDFSIGHRGAPLQFPEHTAASYRAAAQRGAGILECDVTFTADRQLVCRHAQCDLHTTTNVLAIPALAGRCAQPFQPATAEAPASAQCCTSDFTLAELKTLCAKMDGADPSATTVEAYLQGTPGFRTDLYARCEEIVTLEESIALFESLGAGHTPELKAPAVEMPFEGDYTQQDVARQLVGAYRAAGVSADRVWVQSFDIDDVRFLLAEEPDFGAQAVYLVEPDDPDAAADGLAAVAGEGIAVLAPPLYALLSVGEDGQLAPSAYALAAREAGLELIAWTLERSGRLEDGGGWYYQTVSEAIRRDGDALVALDVLAREVGVLGVFSDWPATTSYYASCMGHPPIK